MRLFVRIIKWEIQWMIGNNARKKVKIGMKMRIKKEIIIKIITMKTKEYWLEEIQEIIIIIWNFNHQELMEIFKKIVFHKIAK